MSSRKMLIGVTIASTMTLASACTSLPVTANNVKQVTSEIKEGLKQFTGLLKSEDGQKILKSYQILAQNTMTKELITGATGEDGSFALDLPESDSFVINVLDEEAHYQGTLGSSKSGDSVVTGVKVADAGELRLGTAGQISAVDAGKLVLDEAIKAAALNGVGIGFKGIGTGATSYGTFKNALDEDGDGVPDFLDADDDNNGIRDSIDGKANGIRPDGLPAFKTVNRFGFFTNHPVPFGMTDAPENYVITVDIQAKPEYYSQLKEAKLLLGPSYAKLATIGNRNTPNGSMEKVGLWRDAGMTLYKYTGADGIPRIEGFIMGNQALDLKTQMKVGDVFRFLLTYNDGTREILTNTLDTIYDTVVGNVKVNGTAASTSGTLNVTSAPTVSWDLLKDSSGNTLNGLQYRLEIKVQENPSAGQEFDLGTDISSYNWATSTHVTYDPNNHYLVSIKAQSPGGNTTVQDVRITGRSTW